MSHFPLVVSLILAGTVAEFIPKVGADVPYPASSLQLELLAEQEQICYKTLSKCWERHTSSKEVENYVVGHFQRINLYLQDYETSSGLLSQGAADPQLASAGVPGNPLASLRMLHRFVSLLPPMASSDFPCQEYFEFLTRMKQQLRWPDKSDLEENMLRILRLQQIYNLRTEDVAQGLLGTIPTNIKISVVQMYEMGLVAFKHKFYAFAFQWLDLTLKGLEGTRTESTRMEESVRKLLNAIRVEHDKTWNNSTSFGLQYHFHDALLPLSEEAAPAGSKLTKREVMSRTVNNPAVNYWKLCSGETLKSAAELAKLNCWLESKVHPFWTIAPLKMELLSSGPDIVRVYEIIGENLGKKVLLSGGSSGMQLSTVGNKEAEGDKQVKVSTGRTSLTAWVHDHLTPELGIVSKKVGMVTGLKTTTPSASEPLQVLTYSFGGHYAPHIDCLKAIPQAKLNGDRIATFMYYLSDVQAGGYTAFTTAGVAAEPIKGSAVFWFSLYNDGSCDDPGTLHGGCPVLLGRKYAANKWVRYYDQLHERKCGLRPGEMLQVHRNSKL